jgi:hypothetical protein
MIAVNGGERDPSDPFKSPPLETDGETLFHGLLKGPIQGNYAGQSGRDDRNRPLQGYVPRGRPSGMPFIEKESK